MAHKDCRTCGARFTSTGGIPDAATGLVPRSEIISHSACPQIEALRVLLSICVFWYACSPVNIIL